MKETNTFKAMENLLLLTYKDAIYKENAYIGTSIISPLYLYKYEDIF